MKKRILVLGAGFGGLELSTMLSEAFGDEIEVTLIDKSDSFYFGGQTQDGDQERGLTRQLRADLARVDLVQESAGPLEFIP